MKQKLDWERDPNGAQVSVGMFWYVVEPLDHGLWIVRVLCRHAPTRSLGPFGTLSKARAAADADWKRILSK